MAIELSTDLIELERTAWAEIQAGTLTVETAQAVHEATIAHAEATEQPRIKVEAELKRVVRHPEPAA
ncbi:hypothetical protein OG897_06290 [Streptomyces sp. NBC_00237]|uniref:hypothetical protein n=1 Tax=Streptomyces sp. NBC_00237 TaxID=2975687 RepID=UPI00225A148B|nr:hypothetical protein [Streptomyces sp. NBC_00237]MCX5201071.1 hypothetical protein [Streptomyces sp. NBC_00237]